MASEDLAEMYDRVVEELGLDRESLTVEDLEQVMIACGYRFSKEDIVEKFVETDTDGDWKISLDEFLTQVARVVPSGSPDSIAAGIRRAFNVTDLNSDGFITLKELEKTLPDAGSLDKEMLQSLIIEYDEDGDGKIDFEEFVTMYLKTQILDPNDLDDGNNEAEVVQETKNLILSADDLRQYCRSVETDGFVAIGDMKEKTANLAVPLTDEQFEACINSVGVDEEGRVQFEDFVTAYENAVLCVNEGDADGDADGYVVLEKKIEISADLEVDRDELLNKPVEPEEQELDANENNLMADDVPQSSSNNIMADVSPSSTNNVIAKYPPAVNTDENEDDATHKTQSSQNDTYVIQDTDIVKNKKKMFDGGAAVSNAKKGFNPDIASCNVECKAGGISVKAMMAKFQK